MSKPSHGPSPHWVPCDLVILKQIVVLIVIGIRILILVIVVIMRTQVGIVVASWLNVDALNLKP